MNNKAFHSISYDLHQKNFDEIVKNTDLDKYFEELKTPNDYSRWFQNKMMEAVNTLLDFFPEAKWLTVGDGRGGIDAKYIQDRGINVVASDISVNLLKKAKEVNFINSYSQENLESLSFEDNYFDFTYSKETLHHLPRPFLGIYEMIRVSKNAIVICDLADDISFSVIRNLSHNLRVFYKKILNQKINYFEPVGNYVYGLSEREITKIAMGLSLEYVAFKTFNIFNLSILKRIKGKTYSDKSIVKSLNKKIEVRNLLCKLNLRPYTHINAIIFKSIPDIKLRNNLIKSGYTVVKLPKNPVLNQ